MQIIRTIIWVLLTALVVAFVIVNWGESHDVRIWPAGSGLWYVLDLPVGVIALLFFLVGMLPTYFYFRVQKWALQRKIVGLENAARTAAATPVAPAPAPAVEAAPPPPPPPSPEPAVSEEPSELGPLDPPTGDSSKA